MRSRGRARPSTRFWVFVGALLALVGCARERTGPELLRVVDVVPREIDVGDRIEVLGTNLPAAEAKDVSVTFRGTLKRPGLAPLEHQEIAADRATLASDKVTVVFDEALEARVCGRGDDALHTTFEGDVTVAIPGTAVYGTVKRVTLDFEPPTPRRAVLEAREKEGKRTLDFLGVGVAPDAPPSGGLRVASIRAASPAEAAQLAVGDRLVSFEGVKLGSVADVVPSGVTRTPSFAVQRSDGSVVARAVSVQGFHPTAPSDLLGAGLLLGVAAAILLVFMTPMAAIMTWLERRVSARLRSLGGPSRAASKGLFTGIAERIRSLLEQDVLPRDADRTLVRLAPYLVFVGVSATFVVMPFGRSLIGADLDIGILFVIAVTSLVTIGLLTGGWASNARWSLLGGLRSAAQIVSYEIPGAVAIASLVLMTGSLRLQDLIAAQTGPGGSPLEAGGWPWYWYVFRNPVTFALFFLWLTTALAEGHRAPLELPEVESELAAGRVAERSGMRSLLFFFAEWANVFVMCGIASALFLGGWQLPGVSASQQAAHVVLQLLGAIVFLAKSWTLILAVVWLRWMLPRLRVDQMMSLAWKVFVPLSVAAMLLTTGWMFLHPERTVALVVSVGTFATWLVLAGHFVRRVRFELRRAKVEQLHLNPFL